jgi:ribosomal protein S18 acetylase RimI-like enzyme
MIRPLAAHDRVPLRELLAATACFTATEIDIAEELIAVVLNRPDQRDYHAFVYCIDVRAVGLLIIGPVPATAGTWHLYWIAVHPDQHGAGVAASLAAFAENFVRERAGYLIMAETSGRPAYERARHFYAKHGYAELVRVADYYRPGDDLVLLARRLVPGSPESLDTAPP